MPTRLRLLIICSLFVVAPLVVSGSLGPDDVRELRALWVDAFHAGIRTAGEADALVRTAAGARFNTLFVQVRRRGDALYTRGIEPPLDDPAHDPRFDALDYVVEAGHRAGLEVHAWINAMPVWRNEPPPRDPRHLFNRHGPSASGRDNWLTAKPDGSMLFPVGYFLDPGHPDAAAYLAGIYLDIVRQYAVDGIHFDYVRYPETDERLPRGALVGYNRVSLERFQRATGRSDVPAPDDPAWTHWRRRQVTDLVRRIYIEAKAINPGIKVSAALIPWGAPPRKTSEFAASAPMQRIFQDWHGWLKEGLLDLAVPMNYAREHDPVVRGWFDGWIRWEKQHAEGRHLAIGLGAYLNTPENTLAQIDRIRRPAGRHRAVGVSIFSYFTPRAAAEAATSGAVAPRSEGTSAPAGDSLRFVAEGVSGRPGVFRQPVSVPEMEWVAHPTTGWVAGTAESADGAVDGAVVFIRRRALLARTRRFVADGNGWFGIAGLKPGRYRLWMEAESAGANAAGKPPMWAEVDVRPGQVAHVRLLR